MPGKSAAPRVSQPPTTEPAVTGPQSEDPQSLIGNEAMKGFMGHGLLGTMVSGGSEGYDRGSENGGGFLGGMWEAVATAVDRMGANLELEDQFEIVGDDFKGNKRGNQVTQDEYDKIVAQYSDIRRGKSDLSLDTTGMNEKDADKFKTGAMGDIGRIMQTKSGRELIDHLADNPKDKKTSIGKAATPLATGENAVNGGDSANGTGSDTKVAYQPGEGINLQKLVGAKDSWADTRSDVVLYHELVHSYHDTKGDTDYSTVTGQTGKLADDNGKTGMYEYQGVGLGAHANKDISENKYRTERRELAGHTGAVTGDKDMPLRDKYNFTP